MGRATKYSSYKRQRRTPRSSEAQPKKSIVPSNTSFNPLRISLQVLQRIGYIPYTVLLFLWRFLKLTYSSAVTGFRALNNALNTWRTKRRQPVLKHQGVVFQATIPKPTFRLPRLIPIQTPIKPAKSKRFGIKRAILFFMLGNVTMLSVVIPLTFYSLKSLLPHPKLLTAKHTPVTTKFFDRNGVLLYELFVEENRTPIPLAQIPQHVIQATLAIEDRDFYSHPGFSPRGILRALHEIIRNDRLQGGSTITQQLIKSSLLTPEPTVKRKLKELLLALWTERLYTKDQILEMYLNTIPYGGTAWGIEAASKTYFNKSVRDLSLGEAAILAGLPAAPSEYSPFGQHPERAIARQQEVLRRMVEDGYISTEQRDLALNESFTYAPQATAIRAPHFVMYVKDLLAKRYQLPTLERGGLRIRTTLDINVQDMAQNVVSEEIEKVAALRVNNGAVVVTKPQTGEILAMAGSRDYFDATHDGFVNVTTALRQPGSSIKVIPYAAALSQNFTAATLLDDSPKSFPQGGNTPYTPVNYDGRFHGRVPLRYALGNSYNIPAVVILNTIGVSSMLELGSKMGIDTWNEPSRYGLALALGGGEVTMLDMAEVYGTFANNGQRIDLNPILEISDYTGMVYERGPSLTGTPALSPEVSFIMNDILQDNTARTQAFGPNSQLVIPGKTVAVKTGTTNDKRDNWTVGYTPEYVTVVWVGNNDNSPMHPNLASGVTGAAPIWHRIMTSLLDGKPDQGFGKPPENIVTKPCYGGKIEYFIKGTETTACRAPSAEPTPTP